MEFPLKPFNDERKFTIWCEAAANVESGELERELELVNHVDLLHTSSSRLKLSLVE
ncbi:uncharacterized protein V6R79_022998 [Siganus canaliculatus]